MNVTWFWNSCSRHAKRLNLLAAGVLPEAGRAALEAHLCQCPACQASLKQAQALAEHLRTAGEAVASLEPPASLQRRWREAILREANASPSPSLVRLPPTLDRLVAWFTDGRLAWGAVCACWLLTALLHVSAPDVSRPAVAATSATWKEIRMVLQKTDRPSHPVATVPERSLAPPSRPQILSPRTKREMAVENA